MRGSNADLFSNLSQVGSDEDDTPEEEEVESENYGSLRSYPSSLSLSSLEVLAEETELNSPEVVMFKERVNDLFPGNDPTSEKIRFIICCILDGGDRKEKEGVVTYSQNLVTLKMDAEERKYPSKDIDSILNERPDYFHKSKLNGQQRITIDTAKLSSLGMRVRILDPKAGLEKYSNLCEELMRHCEAAGNVVISCKVDAITDELLVQLAVPAVRAGWLSLDNKSVAMHVRRVLGRAGVVSSTCDPKTEICAFVYLLTGKGFFADLVFTNLLNNPKVVKICYGAEEVFPLLQKQVKFTRAIPVVDLQTLSGLDDLAQTSLYDTPAADPGWLGLGAPLEKALKWYGLTRGVAQSTIEHLVDFRRERAEIKNGRRRITPSEHAIFKPWASVNYNEVVKHAVAEEVGLIMRLFDALVDARAPVHLAAKLSQCHVDNLCGYPGGNPANQEGSAGPSSRRWAGAEPSSWLSTLFVDTMKEAVRS